MGRELPRAVRRALRLEEAHRDPARDAEHPRHDRHRRRELLAVADAVVDERHQVGAAVAGRLDLGDVVGEAAVLAEPLLERLRLLEAGGRVRGHAGCESADLVAEVGGDVGVDAGHGAGAGHGVVHRLGVVGELDAGEVVARAGGGDAVGGRDEVAGVEVVAPVRACGDPRDLGSGREPGRGEVGADADVVGELSAIHRGRHAVERGQLAGRGLRLGDLPVAGRPRLAVEPGQDRQAQVARLRAGGGDPEQGDVLAAAEVAAQVDHRVLDLDLAGARAVAVEDAHAHRRHRGRHHDSEGDRGRTQGQRGVADRPGADRERCPVALRCPAPGGHVVAVLEEDQHQEERGDDREQPPRHGATGHRDREGVRRQQREARDGCAPHRAGDEVDHDDDQGAADQQQRVDRGGAGLDRRGIGT